MSIAHSSADFQQQLAAHQQRVNQALLDFIAPLPFGDSDFVAATKRLAQLDPPAELLKLCETMNREGLALEHEAVWLAQPRMS